MPILNSRVGAAAIAACAIFAGAQALAQTPTRPAAPRPAAPQPAQPQQPAAGAPAQPGQQQAAGSNRIELKPTQKDWTKVCGKDQTANKEICYTTRDFGQEADQQPVLAVAVYDVKGDEQRIVRLLLPVGLLLKPGFRFSLDKGAMLEGTYEICFPNGCFAESKIAKPQLDTMKKSSTMNIVVKNQANNEVIFVVPMNDFGKSFDGAAIDPKVLEEQQKQLQDELQKRAEDERKRLEGAAPTLPPATAPAPAPAAPR
ncbi:MAG: Invasion protein IalB, involved in pathosis [Hyphomicrobiales bacterium]|jgi:invasion protein IalB|nr:Invasion protein IalB, involved in pathosis [Hyphomicrobiales bacterium]